MLAVPRQALNAKVFAFVRFSKYSLRNKLSLVLLLEKC